MSQPTSINHEVTSHPVERAADPGGGFGSDTSTPRLIGVTARAVDMFDEEVDLDGHPDDRLALLSLSP
jgi:hypothetical protein